MPAVDRCGRRIRAAHADDAVPVSALVRASFDAHVAPHWGKVARATFHAENTAAKLAGRLDTATFAAVCEERGDGGAIVGLILLPRPNLVQLCFVAPTQLRRRIGSDLWEAARAHLEATLPEVRTVELNAAPSAVPAYRAMGFYPISRPFDRDGWVATRMACWLPGRYLDEPGPV